MWLSKLSAGGATTLLVALGLLGTVLHEFGHLIACLLVGWKPLSITLGNGQRKTLFHIGDFAFQIGNKFGGGSMWAVAKRREKFRLKRIVVSAGGPIASILIFLVMLKIFVARQSAASEFIHPIMLYFVLFQGIMILVGFCPNLKGLDGKKITTDGSIIWSFLKMTPKQIEKRFLLNCSVLAKLCIQQGRNKEAEDALRMVMSPSDGEFEVKQAMIYLMLDAGKKEAAKTARTALLDNAAAYGKPRSEILDWLASIPIYRAAYSDLFEEALGHIDEALKESPGMITLKGTKGSLLIETGALDDGIRILEEVMATSESKNDQSICLYYMALAYHRKGDTKLAGEWLVKAQGFDPDCPVHKRVEAELVDRPLAQASN